MLTQIFFLLVLIFLNAFFSGSEMALVSVNDNKMKAWAEDGNKKAQNIIKLLHEPSRFLATIQIGITLAGFLASAFASESFADRLTSLIKMTHISISEDWLKTISMIVITLVLSYFTLVLGELVPKRLAMKKAEPIALFVGGPLIVLLAITAPFVKLLTASTNFFIRLCGMDPYEEDGEITEEEIRLMVDVGEEKGTIDQIEKLMINNVFEFNNKTVSTIMTHRIDIGALPLDANLDEVIAFINTEQYSRIPVYQDSIDHIVGVLYSKDLIPLLSDRYDCKNFSLANLIRKPYFVPASKRTDVLFRELQMNKTHIAVIIDEYGGTAGIVTIEDLIEEIVGNIFDEYDVEEKDFEKLDENTYIIAGNADLEDVADYLQIQLPVEEYETLSGFIIGQLGRIPGHSDKSSIQYDGMIFKVDEVVDKRITRVKVCRI